jgi:hypothetical protein
MDDDEEPDRNVLVFDYKGDVVAGLCSVFVMKNTWVSYPLFQGSTSADVSRLLPFITGYNLSSTSLKVTGVFFSKEKVDHLLS